MLRRASTKAHAVLRPEALDRFTRDEHDLDVREAFHDSLHAMGRQHTVGGRDISGHPLAPVVKQAGVLFDLSTAASRFHKKSVDEINLPLVQGSFCLRHPAFVDLAHSFLGNGSAKLQRRLDATMTTIEKMKLLNRRHPERGMVGHLIVEPLRAGLLRTDAEKIGAGGAMSITHGRSVRAGSTGTQIGRRRARFLRELLACQLE
jgi:hypothetical protein